MGNGFGKSKSLLEVGLVDKVERDDGIYYQLSKQGKSLIVNMERHVHKILSNYK